MAKDLLLILPKNYKIFRLFLYFKVKDNIKPKEMNVNIK